MIDKIIKYNLCMGCGLCASVLRKGCEMRLNPKGFYEPALLDKEADERVLKRICPGIRVHCEEHDGIWGPCVSLHEGWSANQEIRHKAASGGVVSSLAIFLLESRKVDAVLQVGMTDNSYLYNELRVSKSKEDVLRNAQSRYAPALVLSNIKAILDSGDDKYAFVGKPCDIAGIRNLIEEFPEYQHRFVALISIFCAGMPSYNATSEIWKQSGHNDEPLTIKYRGEGWPGTFRATWTNGDTYEVSYSESWGKVLGKRLGFRCKICPDGIGMLADISVGDSWNTKNGYPDFTEQEGRCFIFARTMQGADILRKAKESGHIVYNDLSVCKIREMQPYQYQRRKMEAWRLFPVQVMTGGLIDFKGLNIKRQAVCSNIFKGIKNMKGTTMRFLRIVWGGKIWCK